MCRLAGHPGLLQQICLHRCPNQQLRSCGVKNNILNYIELTVADVTSCADDGGGAADTCQAGAGCTFRSGCCCCSAVCRRCLMRIKELMSDYTLQLFPHQQHTTDLFSYRKPPWWGWSPAPSSLSSPPCPDSSPLRRKLPQWRSISSSSETSMSV